MRDRKESLAMSATHLLWAALGAATALVTGTASLAAGQSDASWSGAYQQVQPNALARAMHAAERSTGGRVLEVRLLHENSPGFLAVVAKGHEIINVRVDAVSNQVTKIGVTETPQWMLDWRLKAEMKDIKQAKVAPDEAVKAVEKATKSPAIDVALARPTSGDNSILAYNVEVVKEGMPQRVAIDANTGQIISDPDTVLGPWTPERLAERDQKPTG
jgi:uncharacterized membrane protein YkoI